MHDWHYGLIPGLWIVWMLYWMAAARGVKSVVQRESAGSRAAHIVPLTIAGVLFAAPSMPGWLGAGWAQQSLPLFWVGALLVAAGLLFSVWARTVLGGNWSGTVTIKQDHNIIRAGPYRLIRHPIYTGLLVAFIGSALARPQWRGVLAVVIAAAALWRKLRMEERWLATAFGAPYEDYRKTTWALIPYIL